jgi:outer membrane protein TolC
MGFRRWENSTRQASHLLHIFLGLLIFSCTTSVTQAQLSFTSAIDLALQNSPRVKMATDEVNKALAGLSETKSVFIPNLSTSIAVGPSYGITTSVPTIFTVNAQSLIFNYSQRDYIRAARAALQASSAALNDAQEQVEEDTAISYIALDRAQQRQAAMADEYGYALKLVNIVQDRLDAGMGASLELKQARRTAVQIRLQQLQLEDEIASLREHFSHLVGWAADRLQTVPNSIPSSSDFRPSPADGLKTYPDTATVLSAEANAHAKREQAFGDSRYTWRPQIAFAAQYGRISPINNVSTYYNLKGNYNTAYAAAEIQFSFLDKTHQAKARESLAEADRAEHSVELLRYQQSETRIKLQHSISELAAREELAALDQGIAEDQLQAILVRLRSESGANFASALTPKDEQNARIQERQRYLDLLDATFHLRETQIYLLRQTGQLSIWVQSVAHVQNRLSTNP